MSTDTQGAPAPISPESLPVIAYQGVRVVTTELLSQVYGTETVRIRQNFDRNADRFTEGTHYFKLEGEALREFKKALSSSKILSEIPRQTRSLILWTERGAARHAKMLDTEQAWEVFEKLEDCYFGAKKPTYGLKELPTPTITPAQQNALQKLVAKRAGDSGKVRTYLWSRFNNHFKLGSYKQLPASRFDEAVAYLENVPVASEKQILLPLNDLSPELLQAISRKARALAMEGFDHIRARLEQRLRDQIRYRKPEELLQWLDQIGGPDAELVVLSAHELWGVTSSVAVANIGIEAALAAVHELEAKTGRLWHGRSKEN
jgi:hypothetical protein